MKNTKKPQVYHFHMLAADGSLLVSIEVNGGRDAAKRNMKKAMSDIWWRRGARFTKIKKGRIKMRG